MTLEEFNRELEALLVHFRSRLWKPDAKGRVSESEREYARQTLERLLDDTAKELGGHRRDVCVVWKWSGEGAEIRFEANDPWRRGEPRRLESTHELFAQLGGKVQIAGPFVVQLAVTSGRIVAGDEPSTPDAGSGNPPESRR